MTRAPRSSLALRRYPGLLGAVAFAVLALALPSSLTIPRHGPPTLAEFAPVPGESSAPAAPIADLAHTSSAGIGSGGRGESADGSGGSPTRTSAPTRGGVGGKARAGTKRCVGKPPRQTEDPLSPPCVSFFDGDNGGAVSRGVTGDEVRIAIGYALCDGSNGASPTIVDYDEHPNGNEDARPDPAVLARYFEERYQTYGRRVHLWWFQPGCGSGAAVRRASVAALQERVDPFALVLYDQGDDVIVTEAARRGIVAQQNTGGSRDDMAEFAPYLVSVQPDLEGRAAHIAAFVCAVLADHPARYAGTPTDRERTRRFALVYNTRTDAANRGDRLIRQGIAERCGDAAGEIAHASGQADADVLRWRGAVTTVMFVGSPNLLYPHSAQAQSWYPEWFVVDDRQDNGGFGRAAPPTQARNFFGIWPARRLSEAVAEHDYHRAYKEACPACRVPATAASAYDALLVLFRGIQAAGPRLSAATVERGLRAISPRRSSDPWNPAAYFGMGDHFFIRDASVIRWDPAALPARSEQPGCWRLVEDGARYRVDDWPTHPGDGVFDREGAPWPCQGEPGE